MPYIISGSTILVILSVSFRVAVWIEPAALERLTALIG